MIGRRGIPPVDQFEAFLNSPAVRANPLIRELLKLSGKDLSNAERIIKKIGSLKARQVREEQKRLARAISEMMEGRRQEEQRQVAQRQEEEKRKNENNWELYHRVRGTSYTARE